MAEMSVIAHPYAQALFNLAKASAKQESWLKILADLEDVVKHPDFVALLNNPKIIDSQIIAIIKQLLKHDFSTELANFIQLLVENNRLLAVAEIHHIFHDLVLEDQKCGDAIIESAYALTPAQVQDLEVSLSKKFGKQITAKVVVNPELLAGVKITIKDKVIDSSVKGRLNNLSTQLNK
ncbi:MAG: hypothetical protein RLZZ293_1499 [Pseudomonadota bacterium]|jgi:F-type H+-transporting ATPase subunit delta